MPPALALPPALRDLSGDLGIPPLAKGLFNPSALNDLLSWLKLIVLGVPLQPLSKPTLE